MAVAAEPTAPYDAFTLNGSAWNYSFDSSNATVTLDGWGTGFIITAYTLGHEHLFRALVSPPSGQTLGVGTFATVGTGGDGRYRLDVGGDGRGCGEATGSLTIHALTRDPATGGITSLAASYFQDCYDVSGEIRWHSDRPYVNGMQSAVNRFFNPVDLGHSSPVQTVTITSSGSSALQLGAVVLGGATPEAFTITGDTCTGARLTYGQSCVISVIGRPTAIGDQYATLSLTDNTVSGKRAVELRVTGRSGGEGTYVSLFSSSRLLDTREGNGAPKAPLGGGKTIHLQVAGRGGVPTSKVSAVVLNMTVTSPTSAGYLTVYPGGIARPTASNLNFPAGWTGANSVTVPVGANGQVDIYNAAGNVHVIADLLGYYLAYDDSHTQEPAGQYWPTVPQRLLDSRDPAFGGPLGPFESVTIPVAYGPTFNSHIRALAVNITAVTPTQGGYVMAWTGYGQPPTASTLNFTKGSVVPNFAVVKTAWCSECGEHPAIVVSNYSGGSTHIVVDIFGFYDDGQVPGGLRFRPLNPTRIVDTRDGLGAGAFTGTGTVTVTAPAAVAGDNTYALVTNVTGVNPANSTYLSLWATGEDRPTVSNLNLTPHEVRPNAAFVNVGPGNTFNMFNAAWNVDVVVDVSGTFEFLPGSIPSARTATLGRQHSLRSGPTGTPLRQTMRQP